MSFTWKMNIIGETWSYQLLRCLASDRKSTPKFHYTMLLIWSGEIYYTNLVVSRLFLTWEVMMYFTVFSFGYMATRLIKADHEAAEHFVCHRGLSTNHRRDERFRKLAIFVCWLTPRYILLLLTYFRKTVSMPIVTTGACAVVTKRLFNKFKFFCC